MIFSPSKTLRQIACNYRTKQKARQAFAKPGIPALAEFIMRPQAVPQIGAGEN